MMEKFLSNIYQLVSIANRKIQSIRQSIFLFTPSTVLHRRLVIFIQRHMLLFHPSISNQSVDRSSSHLPSSSTPTDDLLRDLKLHHSRRAIRNVSKSLSWRSLLLSHHLLRARKAQQRLLA